MAKGWSMNVKQRATRQRVAAGQETASWMAANPEPSKADLRASIPAYDESMVKKVPAQPAKKTRKS